MKKEKSADSMTILSKKRRLLFIILGAMIVLTGVLLYLLVSTSSELQQINEDPEGFKLHHVVIVTRHGVRAPAKLSNWSNEADYPMGTGFLTKRGKQGSLYVGKVFRMFYKNFLSNSPREVWARSSTYHRCFETAFLLLSTMYPPKSIWDFGFVAQPIPIIMVPEGNDVNIESCAARESGDFSYMFNESVRELRDDGFSNVGEFLIWLEKVSGISTKKCGFYEPLIDGLYAQKHNDLEIPPWASEKWRSMDWAMRRFSFEYWKAFMPYYGQYIAKTIASRIEGAANRSIWERVSILLYHDTTIQALFRPLKVDHVKWYPSFLSALHFQLYKKKSDGQFYVRTLYHRGFTAEGKYPEAVQLNITDCNFPNCTLSKFTGMMNGLYENTNRSSCRPVNLKVLL